MLPVFDCVLVKIAMSPRAFAFLSCMYPVGAHLAAGSYDVYYALEIWYGGK